MMLKQVLWRSSRLLLLNKHSSSQMMTIQKSFLNHDMCRHSHITQRSSSILQRFRYQWSSSSTSSSSLVASGFVRQFHTRLHFVEFYLRMLSERPVLTKSITAATIYFFADVISQRLGKWSSDDPEEVQWDPRRTIRMFAVGMFMSGPMLHLWFNFLLRYFPRRDLITTIKKIAMSQLIYGPTFTVSFFSLNAFVQGESMDDIISRLKRDFPRTIKSGLMYWPACDFITHRYVPVHLQALTSNAFSFVWTIYFTYMACLKKVQLECSG